MPTLKATWLFNGSAADGNMLFGFSESWYTDDAPAVLLPKMREIAQNRIGLCARNTRLYGYRIADTAPNSRAYTQIENATIAAPDRSGFPNVPQDAALCKCYGNIGGTLKRFWIHCLADDSVNNAQFVADQGIPRRIRTFINLLSDNGFKFRYLVPTAPTGRIQSIGADGVVQTLDPIAGIAVSSVVQLLRVRGTDGRTKKGMFAVSAVENEKKFTLANWSGGTVGMSGKIRLVQYGYTGINQVPNNGVLSDPTIRPGTRKCGRPFGQLRGRAVARR